MQTHPYSQLTPERVLDALTEAGLRPDGRLLSLNSYENRVYQVWLEDGTVVVAKFYRPGRWSDAQIDEEHQFARELAEREIPVVAPLSSAKTGTDPIFRVALYPRRGGRTPELEDPKTLEWIGRFIGRIHAVGATRPFKVREALTQKSFGQEPRAFLLASRLIPSDLLEAWKAVTAQALAGVAHCYEGRARCAPSACTATATSATSSGPTPGRISSTSTMRAWDRPCRTCGCSSPATGRRSVRRCTMSLRATRSSPISTGAS